MTEATKDTGYRFIGDIPESWSVVRLNTVAELFGRIGWQGLTSDEYADEGAWLVTGTDFKNGLIDWVNCVHVPEKRWEEATQIQLKNGDLLITKDGTVGKLAIVENLPGHASLNSGLMRIVPTGNGYLTKYLYYVLQTDIFFEWFKDINAGASTIQHLFQGDFKHFIFPLPPISEQKKIIDYLDDNTACIQQSENLIYKQIDILERYKKSLIHEAVTKGLDPDVPMKPSGVDWIGEIPEHWETRKLKHMFFMQSGDNITSEDIEDTGSFPVYGGNGLRGFTDRCNMNGDHVLIGRQGALCGNIHFAQGDYWASDHAVIVYNVTGQNQRYFYYLFQAMNLNRLSISAAQPGLSVDRIREEWSILPPLSEQEQIAYFLNRRSAKVDAIIEIKRKQVEVLKKRRQSLIYEYVTGKKRVGEED